MKIDIISDTICPWCFIGKRRLEQALGTHPPPEDVEINWQPFQLNPDMPAHGMDRGAYLTANFIGRESAGREFEVIDRAGRDHDIEFRFDLIRRTPNTVNSHRLIHFAGAHGARDAVVEALFRAYFTAGRDIGDVEQLASIAAQAGLDRDAVTRYLNSTEDVQLIARQDARSRALGIDGAPCFMVDGKYAVAGAQTPEVFYRIFDLVREDRVFTAAAE